MIRYSLSSSVPSVVYSSSCPPVVFPTEFWYYLFRMKVNSVLLVLFAGFLAISACTNPIMEQARPEKPIKEETPTLTIPAAVTYTVIFESNGGSTVEDQIVTEGEKATRPENPAKDGYGFANWYGNTDLIDPPYDFDTPITTNITLYAKWSRTFHAVVFMDGENEIDNQIVGENGRATRPDDPEKDGYTFDDWYADIGLTTPFNFNTNITANTTAYAKWIPVYTITYMDVGGQIFSGEHGSDYPTTHTYGTATTLADPTKKGYIFGGWFTNSAGLGTALTSLSGAAYTEGITLYARWNIVSQTGHHLMQIPAGTFMMGSPTTELQRDDDETQHQVTLTKGFHMGKYQVTQAQYEAVMGSNPSAYKVGGTRASDLGGITDTANFPVERVRWYEAIVFCNKLSKLEELDPAYSLNGETDPAKWGNVPTNNNPTTWTAIQIVEGSNGYRLPTEAQWEYACRAGTTTAYNWGTDIIDETQANYNENLLDRTTAVGNYAPNAWGLYDMHGNVGEMCWDLGADYSSGAQTDPTGAGSGNFRIRRGGSYFNPSKDLRSAMRDSVYPYSQSSEGGFRVVRP